MRYFHVTTIKGYIVIFICLSPKAVHLELVSGYSSDDFLAAFRRFTSTRGPCSKLYSDQGTTFVGSNKEIQELYSKSTPYILDLAKKLVDVGTTWSFNPPGAPHFGGICEAAVKSVKHHLRRVVGPSTLTFEEFYTLLKQIEACLNSRPLLPLTDDPSEHHFLSPALLLTQSESYIIPEPNFINEKIPPLQRYKRVQQMVQDWWKQWSHEYLQNLQERQKWHSKQPEIEVNDIVLISDEATPLAKWSLAHVTKIYKGSDGLTRVINLETGTSGFKRPIHKLILLCKLNNEPG